MHKATEDRTWLIRSEHLKEMISNSEWRLIADHQPRSPPESWAGCPEAHFLSGVQGVCVCVCAVGDSEKEEGGVCVMRCVSLWRSCVFSFSGGVVCQGWEFTPEGVQGLLWPRAGRLLIGPWRIFVLLAGWMKIRTEWWMVRNIIGLNLYHLPSLCIPSCLKEKVKPAEVIEMSRETSWSVQG